MIKMSDEDRELNKKLDEWYTVKGNDWVLRDDAPEEIKKIDAMLKKKYDFGPLDW